MRRWFYWVAAVAAVAVVVSIVVASVRQHSMGPVEEMAWFPAVMIAVTSGGNRACRKMRATR